MRSEFVDDDLWGVLSPLIPATSRKPKGGRPPLSDRAVLNGIIYVLLTGIAWKHLPQELECGSGTTCWRRMQAWKKANVWSRMHRIILARLRASGKLNLYWAIVDSTSVRAVKGGDSRDRIPRIVGKEAANTIFWLTPVGFRSWLGSQEPTSRTSSRSSTSSSTSRESEAGPVAAPGSGSTSTRIKATRRRKTGRSSPRSG